MHSLQCSAPRLLWRPHNTSGAPTAAGSIAQRRQHSMDIPCFGYIALLLAACTWCCAWTCLCQLSCVSVWREQTPRTIYFRKHYSKSLYQCLLISSPISYHLLTPQSPFIVQRLILLAQQPHKAESSAESESSSSLCLNSLHGDWKVESSLSCVSHLANNHRYFKHAFMSGEIFSTILGFYLATILGISISELMLHQCSLPAETSLHLKHFFFRTWEETSRAE